MDRVAVMAPSRLVLLLLLLSQCSAAAPRHGAEGWWEEGEGEWRPAEEEDKGKGRGLFVLDRLEKVVESEGGQVRVVRGQPWPPSAFACREGLMHIGFITMEPTFTRARIEHAMDFFLLYLNGFISGNVN